MALFCHFHPILSGSYFLIYNRLPAKFPHSTLLESLSFKPQMLGILSGLLFELPPFIQMSVSSINIITILDSATKLLVNLGLFRQGWAFVLHSLKKDLSLIKSWFK